MRTSAKILGVVLTFLSVATALAWYAALLEDHRGTLTVSFLAVGSGDAVLIEAPSGRRVLIDGGPDDSILRQLGSAMPVYDRSIDIVISTAQVPAKVGGLTSVLSRYSVAAIIRSAARSGSPQAQAFSGAVSQAEQNGARLLILQRGQVIDLGGGASIEALFPDRDASRLPPSDGCLALKLTFGATAFLLPCGPPAVETYLATLDGAKLKSGVLLATGDDPEVLVGFASPQFAALPCGASATSSAFAKLGIQTLDSCEGSVTFTSDGKAVTRDR